MPDVQLADPLILAAALEKRGVPAVWTNVAGVGRLFAREAGIEVFVSGTIEKHRQGLRLVLRVQDTAQEGKSNEYKQPLEGIVEATPEPPVVDPSAGVFLSGIGGVGYPKCGQCLNASYTPTARSQKIQGTMFFLAIVSEVGQVSHVQQLAALEPSLDQAAIAAISKWRLKPAEDVNGRPVAVRVLVEMSFRIY